jgi:hypothetical protein
MWAKLSGVAEVVVVLPLVVVVDQFLAVAVAGSAEQEIAALELLLEARQAALVCMQAVLEAQPTRKHLVAQTDLPNYLVAEVVDLVEMAHLVVALLAVKVGMVGYLLVVAVVEETLRFQLVVLAVTVATV